MVGLPRLAPGFFVRAAGVVKGGGLSGKMGGRGLRGRCA